MMSVSADIKALSSLSVRG